MQEHNVALDMRAQGEHRALLPTFDLPRNFRARQIQPLSGYFLKAVRAQQHDRRVRHTLSIPEFSQRARAEIADLEALRAKKETEIAKQQVSSGRCG